MIKWRKYRWETVSAFLEIGDIFAEVSYQITLKIHTQCLGKLMMKHLKPRQYNMVCRICGTFLQKIVILKVKTRREIRFGSFKEIMVQRIQWKIYYMFVISSPRSKFCFCEKWIAQGLFCNSNFILTVQGEFISNILQMCYSIRFLKFKLNTFP